MDEATGEVTEWSACGDNIGLRISPTGEWLARQQDDRDIRLCNLRTRQIIDVAAPNREGTGTFSANPSWSPDGKQVAWSTATREGQHDLIVYDLATNKTRVIVRDLPTNPKMRPQVAWGDSGILVVVDNSDAALISARLYSPMGTLLRDDLSSGIYFTFYFWAKDKTGKEYLGRYQNSVLGSLADPQTGYTYFAEGIELYSLTAPDGIAITETYAPEGWTANLPEGQRIDITRLAPYLDDFVPVFAFDPHNIAIAPDGQGFAVFDLAQILWRNGKITEVPESIPAADGTGVIWGPMGHRIVGHIFDGAG